MTLLGRAGAALAAALLVAACSHADAAGSVPEATAAPDATATAAATPTYLALGDSVAAGVGAPEPTTGGYVPVLGRLLERRPGCDRTAPPGCALRVLDLAVSGATTVTLLRDQLPRALVLAWGGDVRLVTVTIGGNDVFLPVLRSCADQPGSVACRTAVSSALSQVDRGVEQLLRHLREATGPSAVIAVTTYYDPLPSGRLAALAPLAEQVLEGTGGAPGIACLHPSGPGPHEARQGGPRRRRPAARAPVAVSRMLGCASARR